jgi:hypothetical protein
MHAAAMPQTSALDRTVAVSDDRATAIAAFLALAAVHFVAISHHLPWHDEHQAWLLALSIRSSADVWGVMRLEGHPPLWHLLLAGAQAVSTDTVMLKVVQSAIGLSVLALIIFSAPFPLVLRILLGANYFVIYEYGVIARSYGLGLLLLLLALVAWRTRWTWLILGLAALTSLHVLLLAGAVGLLRLARGDRDIIGVGAFGLCCLVSLAFIWPAPEVVRPIMDKTALEVAVRSSLFAGHALFPLTSVGGWFPQVPNIISALVAFSAGLVTVSVLARLFRDDHIARGLTIVFFAGLVAFGAVVYPMFPRHAGTLVLLVIAIAWVRSLDGEPMGTPFVALAGWLAAVGVAGILLSSAGIFSGSHAAARIVATGPSAGATWGVYPSWYGADLSAILRRPVVNVQQACLQTYVRWNYPVHEEMDDAELAPRLAEIAARSDGEFRFLTNHDLLRLRSGGLDIVEIARLPADAVGAKMRFYLVRALAQGGGELPGCP